MCMGRTGAFVVAAGCVRNDVTGRVVGTEVVPALAVGLGGKVCGGAAENDALDVADVDDTGSLVV